MHYQGQPDGEGQGWSIGWSIGWNSADALPGGAARGQPGAARGSQGQPWAARGSQPTHYRRITDALPTHYRRITDALPTHYRRITDALPTHYRCITDALPMHYRRITDALPMHYRRITGDRERVSHIFTSRFRVDRSNDSDLQFEVRTNRSHLTWVRACSHHQSSRRSSTHYRRITSDVSQYATLHPPVNPCRTSPSLDHFLTPPLARI